MLTPKVTSPWDTWKSKELTCVLVLCLVAAVRVFCYCTAFPFFANVDEEAHFDLVVKYSHGQIPHGLNRFSEESLPFLVYYRTWEYFARAEQLPAEAVPPLWQLPADKAQIRADTDARFWRSARNFEALTAPLYYLLAGLWLKAAGILGFQGGQLLYWIRFLNVFLAAALVWLAFAASRLVFPQRRFLRLGAPTLAAFLPQDTFYSIQSDVLSPLCFGAAFICLVRWLSQEAPTFILSALTGLALAATGLVKVSNLPLLAVAGGAIVLRAITLAKSNQLRNALPALSLLLIAAVLPLAGWSAWCHHVSGDFTGSAPKIKALTWTAKSFWDWWPHPIFTPRGLWLFWSGLMATFWRGELTWSGIAHPLASPPADFFYALSSLALCAVATVYLVRNGSISDPCQRRALWLALYGLIAAIGFLAFLSVRFDFGRCPYPSRAYPYLTSGRLMSGSLIPFLLLYLYGLDRAFSRIKSEWPRWLALWLIVSLATLSEIIVNRPVFSSQYNWFHL